MSRIGILIVEDEGIVASDIARQLARLGYDPVGIAVTGEEAVQMAGHLQPQLVLMDIHLVGAMDGIDAAGDIQRQFGIPVVFLTAYATDEMAERARRVSPLGYIIKPFEQSTLRTVLREAVEQFPHHTEATSV